ncbi:MAG TPA: sodium:proton antiporter [bacterium]|nr:sodium:proton antiporter [bacterium]HOL47538.1 sodium:proton antiporter [bacterium]HPQ19110.1 sodium:proton antiporter [bacterium]
MLIYILTLTLFLLGLYAIIAKKNIIKIIIGLAIIDYAINLFFILIGYQRGSIAPIIPKNSTIKNFVDPLPQALVLTSIVIGFSMLALVVVLAIRLYEKYHTFDITKINKLKG